MKFKIYWGKIKIINQNWPKYTEKMGGKFSILVKFVISYTSRSLIWQINALLNTTFKFCYTLLTNRSRLFSFYVIIYMSIQSVWIKIGCIFKLTENSTTNFFVWDTMVAIQLFCKNTWCLTLFSNQIFSHNINNLG